MFLLYTQVDILLQAKGNHLDQVHSDQMVLEMIRQRPRVSKLRAKGLSDDHSNEIAVEAARREARGPS